MPVLKNSFRKNRNSTVNIDKWRVVINNLQEHSAKQQEHATYRHFTADDSVSNILRAGGAAAAARRTRHVSNRSIPTSLLRSSQTQQRQHAFVGAGSTAADSTLEKRSTYMGIADPLSPYCAEECTCCCCCGGSDGAATTTGTKISGALFDTDSVVTGETADVRTCCSGTDCHRRYDVGQFSSRRTISPCCSYLGTTTTMESFRSPITEMEDETTEAETDLNSPDFSALTCSAPDLFTITRHANHLLDATEYNRIETV